MAAEQLYNSSLAHHLQELLAPFGNPHGSVHNLWPTHRYRGWFFGISPQHFDGGILRTYPARQWREETIQEAATAQRTYDRPPWLLSLHRSHKSSALSGQVTLELAYHRGGRPAAPVTVCQKYSAGFNRFGPIRSILSFKDAGEFETLVNIYQL